MSDRAIDYDAVRDYWEQAGNQSAATASYMAHEQGLPEGCVDYRFAEESRIVDTWFGSLDTAGSILDVGAGAGAWAAHFAKRFGRVVAVEQSKTMCRVAEERLSSFPSAEVLNADAQTFEVSGSFGGIFLGGMLMYLNREDAISLLRRLKGMLDGGGRIIVRESTVRRGQETRNDSYQVVYRMPAEYGSIIEAAGLRLVETRLNTGYQAMEVSERLVDYARLLPYLKHREVTSIGGPVWSAMRRTERFSLRLVPSLLARLGVPWPHLQNHFFLIESAD